MLQFFGIFKTQWRLLDMESEEQKHVKVLATWCCLITHNMIIRFREALRAAGAPEAGVEDRLVDAVPVPASACPCLLLHGSLQSLCPSVPVLD
jgi:hypothetical protein